MAIRTDALVSPSMHEEVRQKIEQRLVRGKEHWKPLHDRMDYWALMYYMQDVIQQLKPSGYRRFISNEPHTAVDLAMSILTRNDAFWRIALFETANENMEERRFMGKIERALQGIVYDIDEMFSMRLKMRFWKQAATQALLRGFIWGKVQITTDALLYRSTPIVAEMYDPRLVYPHVDAWGLNYVLIETITTVGDLVNLYPDSFGEEEDKTGYDPNREAVKVEYWSNDRGKNKGICAVLASIQPQGTLFTNGTTTNPIISSATKFVIEPYYHGYTPESLPVVGVPVNGVNLVAKPQISGLLNERMQQRHESLGGLSPYAWWQGQNSYVAETGRSILAAVEEHIPQYNELIATIMQHLAISTYGTWIFTSPTGEQPKFSPGIESKIALTPAEKLERVQIGAMNADAYKLVEILGAEKQNGMLANILRASQPQQGSGVLFQQMANAALNALEPYQDGMEEFGQRIGTSILAQLKAASGIIKPFEVLTPHSATSTKRQAYWVVEFDPKELDKKRKLRPRPVFKPALPDDLAVRINAARLALDPRRPILSLTTVLEHILQVDDPSDEIDRIWEDIANTDPVLVFEQIAAALERLGETELATRIQEKQFRTAFMEELQFRQASGADVPAPNSGSGGGDVGNMPPDAGGPTQTQQDTTGQSAAPAVPGNASGMQTGV